MEWSLPTSPFLVPLFRFPHTQEVASPFTSMTGALLLDQLARSVGMSQKLGRHPYRQRGLILTISLALILRRNSALLDMTRAISN